MLKDVIYNIRRTSKADYGAIEKAARSPQGFFAVFLAVSEIIFSIVRFDFNGIYLLNKIFFAAIVGYFIGVIASLIPEKVTRILSIILSVFFLIYFLVQLIYSSVFKNYWSLSATGGLANQALDFKSTILQSIGREIVPFLIIIFLYLFMIFICIAWVDFSRSKWEIYLLHVFIVCAACVFYMLVLSFQGEEKNSPANLLKNYSSIDQSVQKLGVVETMLRDGKYMIFDKNSSTYSAVDTAFSMEGDDQQLVDSGNVNDSGNVTDPENVSNAENANGSETADNSQSASSSGKETDTGNGNSPKSSTAKNDDKNNGTEGTGSDGETEEKKTYVPQILDVDLSRMEKLTTNSSLIELNKYINNVQPSYTNDYTGMFEGYNLIFITAEGFDGYMIDKNLTPELYKMTHEGFYFKNFYTPLWYGSTLGGEYANLTGLMPRSSGYLSMQNVGDNKNAMPFCLGNALKKEGYYVCAYHDNEYDYYERDISRPCIGYDNYMGIGNGLEYEKDEYGTLLWPQSDLFMEQHTFSKYCNEDPFHVYYLTVSGHLNYNFSGNAMSEKNMDKVADLPYSETTRAYIACQLEFEYMLEALNKDLERKQIADKTLIVICGDHVPYDNMEILNELTEQNLDSFEKYRNSLIIYSSSMEHSVKVEKPCCSLDILPTVLNLMGVKYDSRMLVGRDILSDDPGLVIMQDGSFITDNYRYSEMTGNVSGNDDYDVSLQELEAKRTLVSNRFRLADAICELDYYSYVEKLLK